MHSGFEALVRSHEYIAHYEYIRIASSITDIENSIAHLLSSYSGMYTRTPST